MTTAYNNSIAFFDTAENYVGGEFHIIMDYAIKKFS
jgi:aryl-alcohol dehydrogenase-like predicted oxidoreductase